MSTNATNMDLIRKKLEELRNPNKGGGKKNIFWKPETGESVVRILPTPDGDPFKQLHFHYNVGKENGFLCPKRNFGDDCPVCGFATKLYKSGDAENMKSAKEMFVRERFFSFVVVRGKEEEGVKLWGYGKRVYEKLLNFMLDPDYGDFTDIDQGYDVKVTMTKVAGKSFPDTDVVLKPKPSVMCEDPATVLGTMPDFNSLFERKTTDDVQNILDAALLDPANAEEHSTETEHYAGNGDVAAPATGEDINAAFAELKGKSSKKSK